MKVDIQDACSMGFLDQSKGYIGCAGSKGGLKRLMYTEEGVQITDVLKGNALRRLVNVRWRSL